MTLPELLGAYGYWVVFVGTFFEGETILILGGLAAHLGYLRLPWVIACAFGGTLLGDQVFFVLGRMRGRAFFRRHRWHTRIARVTDLLERHQILVLVGFRFLYGLRTVTPFVVGLSGIPAARFVALNALGALLWAVTIGVLGFAFGQAFEALIGEVRHYETEVMLAIATVGVVAWAVSAFLRRRRRDNRGRSA